MKHLRKILSIGLGLCVGLAFAQQGHLHNEGVLYVSPQTLMTSVSNFNNKASGVYTNDGEVLLRANYNNDGIAGFTAGADGYTRFQGFDIQELTGASPSEFFDILFDNAHANYAFQQSNDLSVFGRVWFNQGIVDNYRYGGRFTFEEDADYVNVGDQSYVEGAVEKIGSNSFVYPVGKDEMWRPAGVVQLGSTQTLFEAEYQLYDSGSIHTHDERMADIIDIDDNEFWEINDEISPLEETLISLTWDERTTPDRLLADVNKLAVVGWDEQRGRWWSFGGVVDPVNQVVTSVVEPTRFKYFTLGLVHKIEEGMDLEIFNAVNPEDFLGNDYFKIVGINQYPDNRVRIYNRWGVLVYDTTGYDEGMNVFRGISEGRSTIKQGEELPVGTYFYVLDYVIPATKENKSVQGYLYLNR